MVTGQVKEDAEGSSYGGRVTQLARTLGAEPAVSEVSLTGRLRSLSWHELDDRAGRLARTLQEEGVGCGDSLAVCLPNCLEHFVADVAAWKLGAIAVPVNPMLKERELRYVLDDSGAKALLGRSW